MSESGDFIAASETAASTVRRMLVERARRPVPVTRFMLLPLFGVIYGTLLALHPVFGTSPESVLMLTILGMLTLGYAVMAPNEDILDPMRVISFYFLIVFCLAPLAMKGIDWHFTRPYTELLPGAVAYCAAAFILTLVGYHLPIFRSTPASIEARHNAYNPNVAALVALVVFAIGFTSWVVLFFRAGGIGGLVFSDRARGEFFEGFGYFFWGALLMFPGSVVYWAARCADQKRSRWLHALPLVAAFGSFLILQGRMRALNFLILGIFVSHYLIRRIKIPTLGLFASAGLFLSLFIGYVRAPSSRGQAFLDPMAAFVSMIENIGDLGRAFITADLARLSQVVLIIDKVPAWMPYDWGRSLLLFLNPWFRLLGMPHLVTRGVDTRLFELARPDLAPAPTGYLPSFLGEMLFNFPWPIACLFFIPYGMALRWLYSNFIVRRGDFMAVALYAVLLLEAANIILQYFGHVIFEMMIVLLPILAIQGLARRRGPAATALQ